MNAHLPNRNASASKETLGVFIFYNEFFVGVAAKRLADWIGEVAGDRCPTETEIWKLDSIPVIGPLMNDVAREATQADVMIVAATENLSTSVATRWVNAISAASRGAVRPQLLIGLLATTEGAGIDDLAARLTALADRAGIKLILRDSVPVSSYEFESLHEHLEPVLASKGHLPNLATR